MATASDPKPSTPESPTTARPLEMDDDDVNESNISIANDESAAKPATAAATAPATTGESSDSKPTPAVAAAAATAATAPTTNQPAAEPAPPPKPPRPLTEQQKNEKTLKDAFPSVEALVIRAVLTASRGNVEAAFHALLEMTDPDAVQQEEVPPPQPPRPAPQPRAEYGRLSPNSQVLADEEYARQLAQHYESESSYENRTSGYGARTSSRRGDPPYPPYPRPETGLKPNEMWDDREHSFMDDDLPVIRENLRKGFVETQAKFNNWFTGIKKRIDDEINGNDDDYADFNQPGAGSGNPNQGTRPQGRTSGAVGGGRGGYGNYAGRQQGGRSGDYDADPTVLSGDFAGMQLHGDGTPVQQSNPNVFRPPPSASPRASSDRKVAFRDSDDVYDASPKAGPRDSTTSTPGAKTSKWQPMSAVDPTPIADADPFSLGDSEDEKDHAATAPVATTEAAAAASHKTAKPAEAAAKAPASTTSPDDAERLRKAAAEAMADSLVEDKPKAK